MLTRTFDQEPVTCGVCRRAAGANGYAPRQGKPIMWICDDPDCGKLAKTVFHMEKRQLNQFEAFSLNDAGQAAGAYLESIGKFSLAELSEEEWATFLKTVLNSFGEHMRARLLNNVAPF